MPPLKQLKPRSRKEWRKWLEKNHATSTGIWLVYAKKHTRLPTVTYEEAVLEALCFGWIDSLTKSIDDRFHMQVFTPRKPKSAWSPTNKARVDALMKEGLIAPAGLAAIELARETGTWTIHDEVEALTIPPELQRAFDANPDATRNWPGYSESAKKTFLRMLAGAKRAETRASRIERIVDFVARNVSMTVLREAAMSGKPVPGDVKARGKVKAARPTKGKRSSGTRKTTTPTRSRRP